LTIHDTVEVVRVLNLGRFHAVLIGGTSEPLALLDTYYTPG